MQFYNVYSFKENVNAQIQENLYINALNDLSDQTNSAVSQNTFSFERTSVDGILALYTDGYEDCYSRFLYCGYVQSGILYEDEI